MSGTHEEVALPDWVPEPSAAAVRGEPGPAGELRLSVPAQGLERMARALRAAGARFREIAESPRILRQAADRLARVDGVLRAELARAGSGTACGWVEAPQGELVIWVQARDGLIEHVHIASSSLRNWALFEHAFPKDALTDLAFIEHSFGLTPAGADR